MKNSLLVFLFSIVCTIGFAEQNHVLIPTDSSTVYDFPEKMAKFPGEADAFDAYLRKNMVYPPKLKAAGIQGKVYVQFIVEKDGSITNVKVRRTSNVVELDNEAVRLIKAMPKWIPGSIKGKPVRVNQTVPITFSL
jgi:protein TonB